jgi:hypothetical protein
VVDGAAPVEVALLVELPVVGKVEVVVAVAVVRP